MNTEEADLSSESQLSLTSPRIPKKKNTARSLLTHQRSQKFELLLHLIASNPDGIVVCGPKGIGKSTIFDLIQKSGAPNWTVCRINAIATTSFEDIRSSIEESVNDDGSDSVWNRLLIDPSIAPALPKRDSKMLVLLIDDAGDMAPGVLTEICNFADTRPALRAVFAMTADRLYLALSSDPVLANCQIIEIPPLTEGECGEFLQNLSGKPGAVISFKAINPAMIQTVYRKTHGVPGNVVAVLPELTKDRFTNAASAASWPSVALLTLLGAVGAGYWLWNTVDEQGSLARISPSSGIGRPAGGRQDLVSVGGKPRDSGEIFQKSPVEAPARDQRSFNEAPIQTSADGIIPRGAHSGSDIKGFLDPTHEDTEELPRSRPGSEDAGLTLGDEASDESLPDSPMRADSPVKVESDFEEGGQVVVLGKDEVLEAGVPNDLLVERSKAPEIGINEEPRFAAIRNTNRREIDNSEESALSETGGTKPAGDDASKQGDAGVGESLIDGVRGPTWIAQQDPKHFTLQLLATVKLDAMKRFVKSNPDLDELAIFKTKRDGTIWYALIKGDYSSSIEAKQAAETLPRKFRDAWPRQFQSVRKAMVDTE